MPTPIEFPEQTQVFGAGQKEYLPLPAWINPWRNSMGEVVALWQFTDEEWAAAEANGKAVYSTICTFHGRHQVTKKQLKEALKTLDKDGNGVINLIGLPPSRVDAHNPVPSLLNYFEALSKQPEQ